MHAKVEDLPGASMLDEIRRNAEHRLREIEPLIEEAQQLRDVLSVIERHPPSAESLSNGRAPAKANGVRVPASRAAKGANKRTILELVAARPGITPAEIAHSTGVKRTVVASTVSRLKRNGELQANQDGGLRVAGE